MFKNPLTISIADFLTQIGIEIVPSQLRCETFLPGILVDHGRLLADETKLIYPGDLLHEAGHLAVAPGNVRSDLKGEVVIPYADMEAIEIQAIAWSYAATRYLGIEPGIVFHEGGYKGKSEELLFMFSVGVYPGASGLQEAGMTVTGENAVRLGVPAYPHMLKWLRD